MVTRHRALLLVPIALLMSACVPAHHMHLELPEGVDLLSQRAPIRGCMTDRGFHLARSGSQSSDRLEWLWTDTEDVSVEIVLYPGGGWMDVLGQIGSQERRRIAGDLASCLEKHCTALTITPQDHGHLVWRPPSWD